MTSDKQIVLYCNSVIIVDQTLRLIITVEYPLIFCTLYQCCVAVQTNKLSLIKFLYILYNLLWDFFLQELAKMSLKKTEFKVGGGGIF